MQSQHTDLLKFEDLSKRIRIGSLVAIYHAGSGHPGGALSAADLMSYISGRLLAWPTSNGNALTRDRFVLSKGNTCPVLYAAAAQSGLILHPMLLAVLTLGSPFPGPP